MKSTERRRETAFIGLGANLGDPRIALDAAFVAIAGLPGTRLVAASSLYRSAPVDARGPDFLNAVIKVGTRLSPLALLDALQAIERAQGRERPYRNAPRTLDLDLLLFGARCIEGPRLSVPHPRLRERAFVLHPLAEIAPGQVLPDGSKVAGLLDGVASQRLDRLAR